MPTSEQVNDSLRAVIDPELRQNIVELGMVRSIEIGGDGRVDVCVSLTTPGCPIRSHFEQAVVREVSALEGVNSVGVSFDVLSDEEKGKLQQALGRGSLPEGSLAQVKNVICVASGKGGVGKSTLPPTSRRRSPPRGIQPVRSTATSTATRSRGCSAS